MIDDLLADHPSSDEGAESEPQTADPSDIEAELNALFAERPDRSIAGYRLEEKIGAGGMGVVFKGWSKDRHRPLAIKVINRGRFASDTDLDRFRSEIRTLAMLRHPNIVRLVDFGQEGSVHFLVMEFVDGEPISAWIDRTGPSHLERATPFAKVANAVAFANAQGVIHRDLTAANIMVRTGEPVVMDFGLATDLEADHQRTMSGIAVGTPPFMSPEQAMGDRSRIGAHSDVWSLGVNLYLACTGKYPFAGGNTREVFDAILEQEPRRPRSWDPMIPVALERVILKAIQKEPESRYPTAAHLADDLLRIADGQRVRPALPGLVARLRRRVQRRPLPSALLAVIILLCLGVTAKLTFDHLRTWGSWRTVATIAPSRGQLAMAEVLDSDLASAQPHESHVDQRGFSAAPSWQPGDDEVVGRPAWLWIDRPGLNGDLRLDFHVRFSPGVADTIDIALAARREKLREWWIFPPGYTVRLRRLEGESVIILGHNVSQGPVPEVFVTSSDRLTAYVNELDVTIILESGQLRVLLDGQEVAHLQTSLVTLGRDHTGVGIRTYQPGVFVTQAQVYRRSLPELTGPLLAGQVLERSGAIRQAFHEYRLIAEDNPGSTTAAFALGRAFILGLELPEVGNQGADELLQRLRNEHPESPIVTTCLEALAVHHWKNGRYTAALSIAEGLVTRDPYHRIGLQLLSLERSPLPEGLGERALRLVAGLDNISDIDLSGLGLRRIDALAGMDLKRIILEQNDIRDLRPLESHSRLISLDLSGNPVEDLSPLANITTLKTLELDDTHVRDLSPLTSLDLRILKIFNTKINTLDPAFGMQLQELRCGKIDIGDLGRLPLEKMGILSLGDSRVGGFEALSRANTMRFLYLRRVDFDHQGLRALDAPRLTALQLADCDLRDPATLTALPANLERLDLSRNHLPDLPWEQLPPLLDELNLSGNDLETWHTTSAQTLSWLDLTGNPLSAPGALKALGDQHALTCLAIDQVPSEAIDVLATMPALQTILLSRPPEPTLGHRFAERLLRAGKPDLARSIRASAMVAEGRYDLLRSLATNINGRPRLLVPLTMSYDQALELAQRAGGFLAVVVDQPDSRQLLDQLHGPVVAAIALDFRGDQPRWHAPWQSPFRDPYRGYSLVRTQGMALSGNQRWVPIGLHNQQPNACLIEWPNDEANR